MSNGTQQYQYNPHIHVKIWLSNKPAVFMNTENQMRLISMREKNPTDKIHLIYDSSLLNEQAIKDLDLFCKEHSITPVDANKFGSLLQSDNERKLYEFYKDEITHLNEGGNLAVASDILRWLPPVYSRGTYTDFDFPIDTTNLPPEITVDAPLLLNIGSLRTRKKDVILSNNDYIAVVDPVAARREIEQIQAGLVSVLGRYTNDFIEKTEEEFGKDSFFNKYLINFMKNRSESIYIVRSKSIMPENSLLTSRELRKFINEVMTNPDNYLNFNQKTPEETHESVIKRLRGELNDQLGFFKWFFFRNEYNEINNILKQSDDKLIDYLMKKERTLYLKSIVVCTTGPIAIAKFLFNGYVFDSNYFDEHIQPYSFNNYGLRDAFQSKNSIPMHESIFGMMNFLGAEDGKLNDSSWLETGAQLQKSRGELIEERKKQFRGELPDILAKAKNDIELHIKQLEANSTGFFGLFFKQRKQEKIKALREVLTCFKEDEVDTSQLRKVLSVVHSNKSVVYAGLLSNRTQHLIETLNQHCFTAIVFGLTKDRKISLHKDTKVELTVASKNESDSLIPPYSAPGLGFFPKSGEAPDSAPVARLDSGVEISSRLS